MQDPTSKTGRRTARETLKNYSLKRAEVYANSDNVSQLCSADWGNAGACIQKYDCHICLYMKDRLRNETFRNALLLSVWTNPEAGELWHEE